MSFSPEEIRKNRDYFADKLHAEKQRNEVLKATQGDIPYDFVLVDTRGRQPFAAGHIPGAWCGGEEDLAQLVLQLPKDKEIVTYCWSHD
jgi:rhodanese-related sulfurtransferase